MFLCEAFQRPRVVSGGRCLWEVSMRGQSPWEVSVKSVWGLTMRSLWGNMRSLCEVSAGRYLCELSVFCVSVESV